MLIRRLPTLQIRNNLDRSLRSLHTSLTSREVARGKDDVNLPAKIEENLPSVIKREPVPQKQIKHIKVEYHAVEAATFNDETLWVPIYRFPRVVLCRSLIRFKVYVTFVSLATCLKALAQLYNTMNINLLPITMLSSISLIGMCLLGNLSRKLIVQIYTTENLDHVRLSRFTFFGKRLDMVLPLSAVYQLSETNASRRQFYLTFATRRPEHICLDYDFHEFYDEKFRIILRFGGVLDRPRFEKVFGTILRMKIGSG